MKYSIPILMLFLTSSSYAQRFAGEEAKADSGLTFTYLKTTVPEREAIKYPVVREADVMYSKRVERIMDTREKQNLLCQYHKNPLYQLIFDAAERGELTAYKSDSFNTVWRADTVVKMFGIEEIIQVPDRDFPGEWKDSIIYTPYPLETIYRWKIVEEWIIDKQTGEMVPRIVGIAPMMNLTVQGQDLGEYEGFYIKWNQARSLLVNEEAFNRHNDATAFTYYDFFEQQLYSAEVTKVPNVFDLEFSEYPELMDNPLAQLLESQKAKEKRMNYESDLWQY